ncbi:MAG: hypothetical protein M1833_003977 [Piccolia ochrophora]|nr:MAG: hypothetical protein M1833_003977 [Piccolia ochrophora]
MDDIKASVKLVLERGNKTTKVTWEGEVDDLRPFVEFNPAPKETVASAAMQLPPAPSKEIVAPAAMQQSFQALQELQWAKPSPKSVARPAAMQPPAAPMASAATKEPVQTPSSHRGNKLPLTTTPRVTFPPLDKKAAISLWQSFAASNAPQAKPVQPTEATGF